MAAALTANGLANRAALLDWRRQHFEDLGDLSGGKLELGGRLKIFRLQFQVAPRELEAMEDQFKLEPEVHALIVERFANSSCGEKLSGVFSGPPMAHRSRDDRRWESAFARFVDFYGTAQLASDLTVDPSAVYHWLAGKTFPRAPLAGEILRLAHSRGFRLSFQQIYDHVRTIRVQRAAAVERKTASTFATGVIPITAGARRAGAAISANTGS